MSRIVKEIPPTLSEYAELVNSLHGHGTMTRADVVEKVPRLATGVFAADFMLGGGIPINQTTCFVGPEHGGKTSFLLHLAAMSNRICWRCWEFRDYCQCSEPADVRESVYLDVEGKLDTEWAESIFHDVPLSSMFLDLPSDGEEAGDLAEAYLRVANCGIVTVDSLAAILPDPEMSRSLGEKGMMEQPLLISRIVRKLKNRLIRERKAGHRVVVVFSNQIRMTTDSKNPWIGPQETEPGGKAAQFDYSVKMRVNRVSIGSSDKAKAWTDADRNQLQVQRHTVIMKKISVTPLAGSGEFIRAREPIADKGLYKGQIDDHKIVLSYGRTYGVLDKTKEGWGSDEHREKTQDDLIGWWKENPTEYYRTQRIIIDAAKEKVLAG